MYMCHVGIPGTHEGDIRSLGTVVMGDEELPHECLELDSSLLQEEPELLTPAPSTAF